MATTEKYTTVIELNSEQAKRNLDELRKKVESWKSDLAEAREKKMGRGFIAAIRKELRDAEKELKKYDSEVARTIDTLGNLGSASVEQLEEAQKSLKRIASEVPQDSAFFSSLNSQLDQVTSELENIKAIKAFEQLQREADGSARSAELLKAEMDFIRQTAENASTASVKQLQLAERTAESIKQSSKQGSAEWNETAMHLGTIRTRLSDIEESEKKDITLIDRYNQELKKTQDIAKQVANEEELIDRTMKNLSTASVRDIEYSIKALNEQLRNIDRDDPKVKIITERLKELNRELGKVRDMQSDKKPMFSLGGIWDIMNKNWGAITQAVNAVTGLSASVRKSVDEFARMEESMADVRKYSGLTKDEVKLLNEEFRQIDTRTGREQLNALAGAAGRLGIQSRDEILEFVKAADMIGVALGDDLGEGAVDQIGKLAMAFGEDDRMGLNKAMLATGSAINELAQNSSANAGYLVDFTARVAGFGKQLGLTQAQIMGFGAVMDENLLRDEMASTAFGNMLTKMQTDTAKFARIAGKDVKEFADLLKNDANQAILAVADSLKRQDPQTMMKMLDDMGLDGSRAVGVLSTLADKIDDVRGRQELATQAYRDATSVVDEFGEMNNTVQAKLDKCKNEFKEMTVQLGERLLPVVRFTISGAGLLVKTLNVLTNFTVAHWKSIVVLTSGIVAYMVAVNKAVIVEKLHIAQTAIKNGLDKVQTALTAAKTAATTAYGIVVDALNGKITFAIARQRLWNEVIMANPYVAAVAGIMALTAALVSFIGKAKEGTQQQRELNKASREASASIAEETTRINTLVKVAGDKSASDAVRTEALKKLKEQYPQYLKDLSLENINTRQAKNAIDNLTASLLAEAKARVYVQKLMELERNKEDLDDTFFKGISGVWHGLQSTWKSWANNVFDFFSRLGNVASDAFSQSGYKSLSKSWKEDTWYSENGLLSSAGVLYYDYNKEMERLDISIQYWKDRIYESTRDSMKAVEDLTGSAQADTGSDGNQSGYQTEAEQKAEARKAAAARKQAEAAAKKEEALKNKQEKEASKHAKEQMEARLLLNYSELASRAITLEEFRKRELKIRQEGVDEQIRILQQFHGQEADGVSALENQKLELQKAYNDKSVKLSMEQLKRDAEMHRVYAQEDFDTRGSIMYQNEEALQQRLTDIDLDGLAGRIRLMEENGMAGSEEWLNAKAELEQRQRQAEIDAEQRHQQLLERYREQYGQASNEKQLALAINGLEYLHEKELIDEEEYQRMKLAIQAKYAQGGPGTNREETRQTASDMLSVARAAAGDADNPADRSLFGGIKSAIDNYRNVNEQLKILYANDETNHAAYLAAKEQNEREFLSSIVSQTQAAYDMINSVMQAASSYAQACSDLETAKISKDYDRQIEAAGKNSKKREKLEKDRDEKLRAAKTKANQRAMKIELAQAVASTAMAAIKAYEDAPAPHMIWGPIAAGMATAAGMLQIATIKKQHQAEQMGYYEGGFTGGSRYRREAGVVHEGEFVANHQAVNNPGILPMLSFIDQAQRNNTIGSLTSADVSRKLGTSTTVVSAPTVNVQTDNAELRDMLADTRDALDRLSFQLEQGIGVDVPIDGENGIYKRMKKYEQLLKNK